MRKTVRVIICEGTDDFVTRNLEKDLKVDLSEVTQTPGSLTVMEYELVTTSDARELVERLSCLLLRSPDRPDHPVAIFASKESRVQQE